MVFSTQPGTAFVTMQTMPSDCATLMTEITALCNAAMGSTTSGSSGSGCPNHAGTWLSQSRTIFWSSIAHSAASNKWLLTMLRIHDVGHSVSSQSKIMRERRLGKAPGKGLKPVHAPSLSTAGVLISSSSRSAPRCAPVARSRKGVSRVILRRSFKDKALEPFGVARGAIGGLWMFGVRNNGVTLPGDPMCLSSGVTDNELILVVSFSLRGVLAMLSDCTSLELPQRPLLGVPTEVSFRSTDDASAQVDACWPFPLAD
mmetsp:Transcript_121634/g.344098  ORF Transcript_121634/g.344098 Transcript_121634/m.344098 type:complete len:258 (-) Transcript_121634:1206-1979(-)